MSRPRTTLLPFLLAIAAVIAVVLWQEGSRVAGEASGTVGIADVGGPFTLTDQNGHRVTPADFRGRFLLIYFGYTQCPDVCPVTLSVMAGALEKLGSRADRIVPVFITVDPARDTPKVLKSYVASFGPRFVGLTGTEAEIAQAARDYHVYSKKHPLKEGGYTLDHSSTIYLMGPDGKFLANYDEVIGPDGLAAALKKQL